MEKKELTKEEIELLKKTSGVSGSDLELYVNVINRTQLNPFARQIYAMQRGGKLSILTSIDGFRLIAERSGKYAGQTEPQWCGPDGVWQTVWVDSKPPFAARIGVYRSDFQAPIYAVANYNFYASENSPIWKKGAYFMLAKCAEALALRKAFPQELSGLYSDDEMAQAEKSEPERPNVPDAEIKEKKKFQKLWQESENKETLEKVYGVGPDGLRSGYEAYKTQPGFVEFEALAIEKAGTL